MFEKAKATMYARRVIVLDNVEALGWNKQLGHALMVLNSYRAVIEDIHICDGSNYKEGDIPQCVKIKLYIRCRCVDWARIENNLTTYVYEKEEFLPGITTEMN